jgi:hypothetical protein
MKKQPKLTPLFPSWIKPARVGVYQHEFTNSSTPYFSLWNGAFWCANTWEINEAALKQMRSNSAYGSDFSGWRGLAADPVAKTIRGIA